MARWRRVSKEHYVLEDGYQVRSTPKRTWEANAGTRMRIFSDFSAAKTWVDRAFERRETWHQST